MKKIMLLAAMLAVCNADNIAMASSNTDKTQKTYNTIPMPQKSSADIYYAQQYQAPAQQQVHYQAMLSSPSQSHGHISPTSPTSYLQFVPRQQYYMPAHSHPTPTAIMIIAQPALVPHQLVYGPSAMQHLLNYFHSNPQAKYQLLHGNYPGATPAPHFSHTAHSIPQYQYVAAPSTAYPAHYANYIPVPMSPNHATTMYGHYQAQGLGSYAPPALSQHTAQQAPSTHQYTLGQLAALAAQAQMQHGSSYPSGANAQSIGGHHPLRQAPAIITGLENFTPEQQAQIKQQLSSHLGPLTTLSALGGGGNGGSNGHYNSPQNSYASSKVLGNKISDSAEQKSDGPFIPFDPSYHTISSSDSSISTSSKS